MSKRQNQKIFEMSDGYNFKQSPNNKHFLPQGRQAIRRHKNAVENNSRSLRHEQAYSSEETTDSENEGTNKINNKKYIRETARIFGDGSNVKKYLPESSRVSADTFKIENYILENARASPETISKEDRRKYFPESYSEQFMEQYCNKWLLSLLLLSVIALIGGNYVFVNNEQEKYNITYLKERFKTQDNETWDYLEAVIDDALSLEPVHPAVFLFLYTGDNSVVNELVDSIAKYASSKLNTNENYINIEQKEFHSKEALADYGYLIVKYKPLLEKKQVMLVKELHHIPASVAQIFHSFCDEITPQVERAVFIFTLKVNSLEGRPIHIAETFFQEQWTELNADVLMPLVTRITSTVLKVRD